MIFSENRRHLRIIAQPVVERIGVPDGYPAMKQHRLKRPALPMELLMALAASLIAGMFAWYAVLIWRFFFD
jgi:hypothetical protein